MDSSSSYTTRAWHGRVDPAKPLMEARACFKNHIWYHINFWARSRSSNPGGTAKIKRSFAELRYKQDDGPTIVETCTLIGRSCGFCPGEYDILHPINGKYLSGKRFPVIKGEFTWHGHTLLELPFTGRRDQARRRYEDGTGLFRCLLNWVQCIFHYLRAAFAFWRAFGPSEQASD
ncbi:hypothetical protein SETIT_2G239900v2 [Setaria italica]|uniref:DUF3615 domain-containing protein n=1 Tax=Setaria italica TaxID=4555 RepID=K4A2W4_SETIT|nr:hypothetical protein SETIT_2G239900v2 [Setaria italica]